MSTKNEYGFYSVQYGEMQPIPSVNMGDGSVMVSSLSLDEGRFASVGFGCGKGHGVGEVGEVPAGMVLNPEMGVNFLLRFDNPDSIDVVIAKLLEAKKCLIESWMVTDDN